MRWMPRAPKQDWSGLAALIEVALRAPNCDSAILRRLCASLDGDKRRVHDTIAILRQVVARLPDDADLRLVLVRSLLAADQLPAARSELDIALQQAPQNPRVRLQHFALLVQCEQWAAASALGDEIAAIDPMHFQLFDVRMRQTVPQKDVEAQLAACDAALAEDPAQTDGIYFKAVTLARLGRIAEARALLDPKRYLTIGTLAPPDDRGSDAVFRDGLASEIRRHPDLIEDGHAARGRRQTLQLRHLGDRHIEALLGQIRKTVDDYERRLPIDGSAFVRHRPRQAKLAAWAIIYDRDGHQLPHRHSEGWLSGVYYVTAPRVDHETCYRGPLVVGDLPSRYELDAPPWSVIEIEPVPGRIVLFPSYVPHSTRPTNVEGERICVAFDVVPS